MGPHAVILSSLGYAGPHRPSARKYRGSGRGPVVLSVASVDTSDVAKVFFRALGAGIAGSTVVIGTAKPSLVGSVSDMSDTLDLSDT